jgi:aminopeptidase N
VLIRVAAVLAALGLVTGGASAQSATTATAAPSVGAPGGAPGGVGSTGIGDPYFPEDGNGGIDVRSYQIHDRYLFDGRLTGWTRLTLRTQERLRSFDLDFLLPVSAVRLSTGPATFSRTDQHELRIEPRSRIAAGRTVVVTVRYAGRPGRYHYAGESNWVADDREAEAVNEPHMAPWWFPSNDHPLDKARMDVHLTVPRGRQVVSNGRLLGVRRTARRATYHWGGGGPMATYLAFFLAGRFEVRQGIAHHLPYYLAVSRGLGRLQRVTVMRGLRRTPGIVHWLQRQAGQYPFRTTGGVVTELDPGFSLENQTRPVYPLDVSKLLMVHELAHQWFGDSVSVHHWADVWLNEGFATYMEHRWTEGHGGETTARWLRGAYGSTPGTSSFWDLVVADPGPDDLFDWPVYQRGAMTLAALRNRIGGRTFTRVLHRWTALHRYGHGSTASFEALAERVSGQDLTSFFDVWVRRSGKPDAISANGL